MNDTELLNRVTSNAEIFGGKPIVRGRRLAVEHGEWWSMSAWN
jgi:uncharacterized protein (DUF433 family)